jgi:hypothetical protein
MSAEAAMDGEVDARENPIFDPETGAEAEPEKKAQPVVMVPGSSLFANDGLHLVTTHHVLGGAADDKQKLQWLGASYALLSAQLLCGTALFFGAAFANCDHNDQCQAHQYCCIR